MISRTGLETFAYINCTARDASNYGTQCIWYHCKKYKINTHNWLGEEKSCYSYCSVPLTVKCILLDYPSMEDNQHECLTASLKEIFESVDNRNIIPILYFYHQLTAVICYSHFSVAQ